MLAAPPSSERFLKNPPSSESGRQSNSNGHRHQFLTLRRGRSQPPFLLHNAAFQFPPHPLVHVLWSVVLSLSHSLFGRAHACNTARTSILRFLRRAIRVGHLEIVDSQGTYRFGTWKDGRDPVRITVNNDEFYAKVLASADLGLSESYMVNDIDIDNLKGLMDVRSSSHASIPMHAHPLIALAR